MKRSFALHLFAGLFLVLFCSLGFTQDVKYNFMPGTDFTKYKTYKWVVIDGAEKVDQITDQQIKQAVDTALATKGLTKSDADKVDVFVAYQVAVNQERQWNAYGGVGLRFGGMASATSSTINIGTLALDVYDASNKNLLWTGDATKTMSPSKDPQKNMANLQKAVNKLLANYPPPPPSK